MSDIKDYTTEDEYLVQEPQREYKSEYRQGRTVAMSGASSNHNIIATNLLGEIRQQLKHRPCIVYGSDMRVKVATARFYTYPDVSIVCEKPTFADPSTQTLLNPVIIIEVLSPSTQAYDRGEKFGYFKKLASVREYVLVSQDQVKAEHFVRQENGVWTGTEINALDGALELGTAGCRIDLREVYDKTSVR